MTQLVRQFCRLSGAPRGGIVTIGNFDGVHVGHQALLKTVVSVARAAGKPAIAVTFEPLPQTWFSAFSSSSSRGGPARLTDWRQRFCRMAGLGLDAVIMLSFDQDLAALTAEQFVQSALIGKLAVSHVIVGEDFRFGQARTGTVAYLQSFSDFTVEVFPGQCQSGKRISSTAIRNALARGDFREATQGLGRPWTLSGRVVHGEQRGRQLGFPTANILLREVVPVSGVYAVRASGAGLSGHPGVANVGVRPTVGGKRRLLEVHLTDFSRDIYGERLEMTFCHKIRDEQRFGSLDLLKEQIAKDAETARHYFSGQ